MISETEINNFKELIRVIFSLLMHPKFFTIIKPFLFNYSCNFGIAFHNIKLILISFYMQKILHLSI